VATDPEDAVRAYLRWREDPDGEPADTAEIDARIAAERDPLERVKLRSERERLADRGPRLEAAFVTSAREWAERHGVTADAFLAEGVERRVLAEAGLLSGTPRTSRSSRSRPAARSGSSAPSGRSSRVRREDVAEHVRGLRQGTTFTTATITNDAGGSPATVRKVLDELVATGVIAEQGKDHSGPGRPRTLYTRTGEPRSPAADDVSGAGPV
jgi:hypothetical protein